LDTNSSSSTSNAARYQHIATAEIVKLSKQGLSHREIAKVLSMGPCTVGTRLRGAGIVRSPEKLTDVQLKEHRADPAWQARCENRGIVPDDKVTCLECGELKSEINANGKHSHLRTHRMTATDYKKKYPWARLTSFGRSADQNRRQGRTKAIKNLMDEFADSFLRPMELKAFRRDQEYEERHGIQDFVACRMNQCGFKSQSDLHTHLKARHSLTSASYRNLFPKALQLPLGLYEAKNKLARMYGKKKRAAVATLEKRAKPFLSGGPGRHKLPPEETSAFAIGREVEAVTPRAHEALEVKAKLPSPRRFEGLKAELSPRGFSEREIELVHFATRAKQLARRFIADRQRMTMEAVSRAHQRYLSQI
jgi:predicted transcriptional regulator